MKGPPPCCPPTLKKRPCSITRPGPSTPGDRKLNTRPRSNRCRDMAEKEKVCSMERSVEISKNKRRLTLAYRLINHLLSNIRPAGKKWKILLVSDSTYQVDRIRQALENLNFEVVTAPNGKAGLEKALEIHPRIIVSDLEMPEFNGLEFCRAVKNQEKLAPNYFIISTANADRVEESLKPEYKVDDVLIKPSRADEFQEYTAPGRHGVDYLRQINSRFFWAAGWVERPGPASGRRLPRISGVFLEARNQVTGRRWRM